MRKSIFLVIFILLFTFCTTPAFAAEGGAPVLPVEITAEAAYVVNLNTGDVVYEKNAEQRRYPASTTKLMTCILAFESGYDLDTTEITAKGYLYDEFAGLNVSTGDIRRGETLTLRQLIYAMLLQSANEAASIVADFLGDGSIEVFSEMMNERAAELGCTDTNFTNPHGLFNENHYTTARDLALIAQHAYNIPGFMEIAGTYVYNVGQTNIHETLQWVSTNKMLSSGSQYYYEPVKGMKTGTIDEAGSCFVSAASLNGYDYIAVVLGSKIEYDETTGKMKRSDTGEILNHAFADTKKLYDWAFNNFSIKTLMENGTDITEVPLKFGRDTDHMKLASAGRFTALVPDEMEEGSIVQQYELPPYIAAPVKKGDVVGQVHLLLMNEEIGTVPLVATQNVERSDVAYLLAWGEVILYSFWFKFALIFLVVFITLYVFLMLARNRSLRRYHTKPPRR